MFVLGTRPEAIKLAPVITALPRDAVTIVLTGQHRDLARAALEHFDLVADIDLALMRRGWSPATFVAAAMSAIGRQIALLSPSVVVVQGDTTTAIAAALATSYAKVPLAHVEAGLRSGMSDPFPEELQRRLIGQMATIHFAPTAAAAAALRREGVMGTAIHVTGNPVIDALHATAAGLGDGDAPTMRPLILVTAHRRENHGAPMAAIAEALATLASPNDLDIIVPLHPHPRSGPVLARRLRGLPGVTLSPPLDYPAFVALLRRARLVLTDSGGVQEEAPAFGCPVLILRDVTERGEGVAAGAARLVGTNSATIVAAVRELIDDDHAHAQMSRASLPYGDGHAAHRIAAHLSALRVAA
jgi:UDP-N-acetylglucosamine 2-epimerase (non-hydrolysing)